MLQGITLKVLFGSALVFILIGVIVWRVSDIGWTTKSNSVTNIVSEDSEIAGTGRFGRMRVVSNRNGAYYLTISLSRFIRDNRDLDGYRIESINTVEEFRIAPGATITLKGDALTELIDLGIIIDPHYNLPSHRIQTFPFIDLIQKAAAGGYNLTTKIKASFQFVIKNNILVSAGQQYVP